MNGPRTVCVTGMHRSGTSLVTRVLELMGVSLGRADALMGPGPDNLRGYFEIRAMKELDDELLAHLGGAWDRPPVLGPMWELDPALDAFRARADAVLRDAFESTAEHPPCGEESRIRGWKDPRQSLLLPFWRTVTTIDTTVIVVRDPFEVIASLGDRNGMDTAHAALLWLRYLLAATSNDRSHLLVRNDDLFGDLDATLGIIGRHLGLPEPDPAARAEIRGHLDPDLRHHRSPASCDPSNPVVNLALAVWNDGDIDLTALDADVARAVRDGWLRPPADDADLTAARAQVVELQEAVRRRKRKILGLERDVEQLRSATASTHPIVTDAPDAPDAS